MHFTLYNYIIVQVNNFLCIWQENRQEESGKVQLEKQDIYIVMIHIFITPNTTYKQKHLQLITGFTVSTFWGSLEIFPVRIFGSNMIILCFMSVLLNHVLE